MNWLNHAEVAARIDVFNPTSFFPAQLRSGREAWTCAWSPDAMLLAWSCGNQMLKILPWNRYKNRILQLDSLDDAGDNLDNLHNVLIDAGDLVWSLAFGSRRSNTKPDMTALNWSRSRRPDDVVLAAGLSMGHIRIYDALTGKLQQELAQHLALVRDLKFAPDGSLRLASASRDGQLKVWIVGKSSECEETLDTSSKWVYSCSWSPSAKILASVGSSGSVIVWDMCQYKLKRRLEGHSQDVCSCDFSPDGALLVTCSFDSLVVIWDPHIGVSLIELSYRMPIVSEDSIDILIRGVSFSHDGRHLATVSDDGLVRFWDICNTSEPQQVAQVLNGLCCRYSPDGAVLAVGTRSGSLSLFLAPMQVSSLQQLCRLAMRRLLTTQDIDELNIPNKLHSYLRYEVHW